MSSIRRVRPPDGPPNTSTPQSGLAAGDLGERSGGSGVVVGPVISGGFAAALVESSATAVVVPTTVATTAKTKTNAKVCCNLRHPYVASIGSGRTRTREKR